MVDLQTNCIYLQIDTQLKLLHYKRVIAALLEKKLTTQSILTKR